MRLYIWDIVIPKIKSTGAITLAGELNKRGPKLWENDQIILSSRDRIHPSFLRFHVLFIFVSLCSLYENKSNFLAKT